MTIAAGWAATEQISEGLASLVDNSLLRKFEAENGERSIVMLETIKEYATERLDDVPDLARYRCAHAGNFADLARGCDHGPERGWASEMMSASS